MNSNIDLEVPFCSTPDINNEKSKGAAPQLQEFGSSNLKLALDFIVVHIGRSKAMKQ